MHICCVSGCLNNDLRYAPQYSFFRFPLDISRCKMWQSLPQLRRSKDLTAAECYKRLRVCSQHFSAEQFSSIGRHRLKKYAIPNVFPQADVSPDAVPSTSYTPETQEVHSGAVQDSVTQTVARLSASTPRKVALKKRLKGLQRKLRFSECSVSERSELTKSDIMVFISEHYPTIATFINTQIELLSKAPKGARYSSEFKQFALTIYFMGPKVYKFLQTTFRLPSKSTLNRITSKWEIGAGFSDFVMEVIRLKTDLLDKNSKDCTICIDEMSLKTFLYYNIGRDEIIGFHHIGKEKEYFPVNNVLTLMARGINSDWKQPLAYFFLNSTCSVVDLKNILDDGISRLLKIGLNVLSVVSDQGSNFVKFTNSIGVTAERPYFYVNTHRILYIFDVPHLLKSTRNNFFTHFFDISGEGRTNKKYLDIFYERDKTQVFRLAPKLTQNHIYCTAFTKMKVKYAAQVFSASVAAGMYTYISFDVLPADSMVSVKFIEKMDILFDILNSWKCAGAKDFNRAFIGSGKQVDFLLQMAELFKTLVVLNKNDKNITNSMKFINGWRVTIASILQLWEVLKTRNITSLFTRRLDQDCLENYFGKIRTLSGNNRNPTPIQFSRAFRKLFALNYFVHADGANCIEELDSVLAALTPETLNRYKVLLVPDNDFEPLVLDTCDYHTWQLPDQNAFEYFTGYLVRKCLQHHSCDSCASYASSNQELHSSSLFSYFKAYKNASNDTFGNLACPRMDFNEYISNLEYIFSIQFSVLALYKHVGHRLMQQFLKVTFHLPCTDFPTGYLLKLFTRVRIFYTLKFMNREFKENASNRKEIPKLRILQHL